MTLPDADMSLDHLAHLDLASAADLDHDAFQSNDDLIDSSDDEVLSDLHSKADSSNDDDDEHSYLQSLYNSCDNSTVISTNYANHQPVKVDNDHLIGTPSSDSGSEAEPEDVINPHPWNDFDTDNLATMSFSKNENYVFTSCR